MTREELTNALKHPQDRELQLRAEARSLASQQYLYYKILRLAADVPMYKWYLTPELLPTTEYSSKDFVEEDKFVNHPLVLLAVLDDFLRHHRLGNALGSAARGEQVVKN